MNQNILDWTVGRMGKQTRQTSARKRDGGGDEVPVDQVECCRCKSWFSKQQLGIESWSNEDIRISYVICRECILALRDENCRLKKRNEELEEIVARASRARAGNLSCHACRASVNTDEGGVGKGEDKAVETEVSVSESVHGRTSSHVHGGDGVDERSGRMKCDRTKVCQKKIVKHPIVMVGDSGMSALAGKISVNEIGSEIVSLGRANVIDIRKHSKLKIENYSRGLFVLHGGGNGLKEIGVEKTVQEITSCVREVHEKNMSVAVIGILRRPREDNTYERMRRDVNMKVFKNLMEFKIECFKMGERNVSFLDPDCIRENMFGMDGMHLNPEGTEVLGRKVKRWVQENCVEVVRTE